MWSADLITDQVHEDILFTQPMSDQHKINKLLKELYHSCTVKSADGVYTLTTFCNILKDQSSTAIGSVVKDIEHDMQYLQHY